MIYLKPPGLALVAGSNMRLGDHQLSSIQLKIKSCFRVGQSYEVIYNGGLARMRPNQ